MRIGVTTFGGDGGKSGISQYIIKVLQAMARLAPADEIEVLVYADERDIFLSHEQLSAYVAGSRLRSPLRDILWHQTVLPHLCRKRRYDVLFLPAGNRRLPFACPCPTVGVVHDFSWLHVPAKYDRVRLVYLHYVLPRLIARLDRVITISHSSARDIETQTHLPAAAITVIPNGVDHNVFMPGDFQAARHRVAALCGDQPFILFISRIEHPGKNHVRLIEAFERFKARTKAPHRLVLAGSDFSGAASAHQRATASPVSADIIFTGFVPNTLLPDLYRAADIFIFPSLYEGFGLPILEAMACGVPVACANCSSLPEVAGDAALLFDPHDEHAMAAAIERLTSDQTERTERVKSGLERARLFSWDSTARQTLAVLHDSALPNHLSPPDSTRRHA